MLIWARCITVTLKSSLESLNIEIDGGALMNAVIVTFMMVQMGYPTGICEVRSQRPHKCPMMFRVII